MTMVLCETLSDETRHWSYCDWAHWFWCKYKEHILYLLNKKSFIFNVCICACLVYAHAHVCVEAVEDNFRYYPNKQCLPL